MQPRYSLAYIREFIRVLQPGGLLVFQLPSKQVGFKKALKKILPFAVVNLMRMAVYRSGAVMEMHKVAEDEGCAVIEGAGAAVADVRYNQAAGADYTSPEYYTRK